MFFTPGTAPSFAKPLNNLDPKFADTLEDFPALKNLRSLAGDKAIHMKGAHAATFFRQMSKPVAQILEGKKSLKDFLILTHARVARRVCDILWTIKATRAHTDESVQKLLKSLEKNLSNHVRRTGEDGDIMNHLDAFLDAPLKWWMVKVMMFWAKR